MLMPTGVALQFDCFYTASKQAKTGLTVTVNVYRNTTLVVTGGSATEVGDGFYTYQLAAASNTVTGNYRAKFITSDTTVDQQHMPGIWVVPVWVDTPNLKQLNGTTLTARDIGASVLLSAGTGTGQLDFTSGVVKSNLVQILATALTETAGQIAAGFKAFFNVLTPTLTVASVNQTGDNYARIGAAGAGLTALGDTRIANLDAAVSSRSTFAGGAVASVTGNVGGNVVGSVGSVTGAVGSVTGAVGSVAGSVGSVTGNVGGNVTGSVGSVAGTVASVTGAVGSVTGSVGSVVGAVGSVTANVNLNLAQAVPTSNTAQTVGDALNAARADGFGKWVLSGTTLTLYAPDGTTAVRTFTLDSATTPTQRS